MFQNCAACVVLITTIVSVSAKSSSPADNATEPRPVVSEFHAESSVANDNICNSNERKVAFDVILFDNVASPTRKKRQAPGDSRNDYRDRPRPDQRSLLIVFDGTGSMADDLQQLRAGAQEIVNELSAREDNPIYNYVLVVYRDPGKFAYQLLALFYFCLWVSRCGLSASFLLNQISSFTLNFSRISCGAGI